jgi:hypothetical protein
LNGTTTEIDHDQTPIVVVDPAPGHKIPKALIVGPTAAIAKVPLTIPKHAALTVSRSLP